MLVLGLLNKFAEFLKLLILSLWEARPGGGWAWGEGGSMVEYYMCYVVLLVYMCNCFLYEI